MELYQIIFNDFDYDYIELGAQLGDDWFDNSWVNDSCPSFSTRIGDIDYTLYFDYDNADLSELSSYRKDGSVTKFSLIDEFGHEVLNTNDWETMKNAIVNDKIVQKHYDNEQEKRATDTDG